MNTIEMFQALFSYNQALYQRVWDSIMQLSEAQFTEAVAYSHGSLREQMMHVIEVDKRWLLGLEGDPRARTFQFEAALYESRTAVYALWQEISQAFIIHVNGLTTADLEQHAPQMPGPIWHVLTHVVNHGTDHRAQILRVLHDFGAPTFDQDLVLHLWFS